MSTIDDRTDSQTLPWTRSPRCLCGAVVFAIASLAPVVGAAQSFDSLDRLSQPQFEALVTNLGASTQYKAVTPGEPLGVFGADIGIELTSTDAESELFELAGSDATEVIDTLLVSRLHVHKGLPRGLDLGAFVGAVADTDLTVVGAEARLALLRGSTLTPSLGVRLAASRLQGTQALELDNYSAELVLSKGFLPFTPYIGAGLVRTVGTAANDERLEDVSVNQEKLFAGLNVNLGVNLAFEADITGDYTTYSAKAGFRF